MAIDMTIQCSVDAGPKWLKFSMGISAANVIVTSDCINPSR